MRARTVEQARVHRQEARPRRAHRRLQSLPRLGWLADGGEGRLLCSWGELISIGAACAVSRPGSYIMWDILIDIARGHAGSGCFARCLPAGRNIVAPLHAEAPISSPGRRGSGPSIV